MEYSWLLAVSAEIEAIKTEIQGMVAENTYREFSKLQPAYVEKDFQEKAQQLWGISNYIMTNRG